MSLEASNSLEEGQLSLLPEAEEMPEIPLSIRKNDDLTRQVRNLLLLYPITRLEADKLRLGPEQESLFKGIDTLFLSFSMFDFISECMVFESGATRELIIEHLSEEVARLRPEQSGLNGMLIAEIVLDQLCNSRENHRSFQFEYFDAKENKNKAREFRLVLYKIGDDGEGRYYLTNEGFTAYLSMLELDAQVGQEVDEYLIRRLMERGNFGDALRIAKRNRKRTIELKDSLHRQLFKINRDIQNIDWGTEIRPYLDQSRTHIKERIEEEGSILGRLGNHLELAKGVQREELIHLQETIQECQSQHRKLHSNLMGFNEKFLDAQTRAFRTPRISSLAHLETDILMRMLDASMKDLGAAAQEITSCLNQPKVKKIFDPLMLISFIDNADAEMDDEGEDQSTELVAIDDSMDRFDQQMIRDMTTYLEALIKTKGQTELSAVIQQAEVDQLASEEILCLIYLVMQWYGDTTQTKGLRLEKQGKLPQNKHVSGDNLSISGAES